MIHFQKINPSHREQYEQILLSRSHRGSAYSFANLCMWGRQQAAVLDGHLVIFSQFGQSSIYPYPVGQGNIRPVLDAIIEDAHQRGIICRLTNMSADDCMLLEELYPGKFQFHPDRNYCDYVYKIEALATLKGRKFQKKRNHLNKFRENHPNCRILPLDEHTLDPAREMVDRWYAERLAQDPQADYHLEQHAIRRAFAHTEELALTGLVLEEDGEIIAVTMGSRLSDDTFDIHFEKAREDIDGAYAAINQAFAAHLAKLHPELVFLNREDDMGLPGLRKAKLSYNPDHLVVKFWARLWEDEDED